MIGLGRTRHFRNYQQLKKLNDQAGLSYKEVGRRHTPIDDLTVNVTIKEITDRIAEEEEFRSLANRYRQFDEQARKKESDKTYDDAMHALRCRVEQLELNWAFCRSDRKA